MVSLTKNPCCLYAEERKAYKTRTRRYSLGVANGLGIKRVTRLSYVKMDPTASNIVQLTMLGVVVSMLAVVCKRMQHIPTMLGPALHRGKDTAHQTLETFCNERAWSQKCQKSCANGSNIVVLRFGDHETTEMLGVIGSKLCATTPNNTQQQQGVQTDATCNI